MLDRLAENLIRIAAWLVTRALYRVRVLNPENIPARGPAVVVSNHVSYLDAFLIGLCLPVFPRFLLNRPYYERLGPLARLLRTIPLSEGPRRDVVDSLETARRELQRGGVVGIFPEGGVTRTGNLLPFRRGLEKILEGTDAQVTPVWLEGLHGGWLSYRGARFVRRPPGFRRRLVIAFGKPLPPTVTALEARQAVMELGAQAAGAFHGPRDRLERRFIVTAKRHWGKLAIADSTGRELSFGRTLAAAIMLARRLRRRTAGEPMIGIVLPATAGAALANLAVLMSGQIPVNLNFTAGRQAMNTAIQRCGLRTLLTSRAFLAKANLAEMEGMAFLEDLLGNLSALEKLSTLLLARLTPARLLERLYGGRSVDDTATVIFSSGSTAEPKGVVLSHRNIISNIDSLLRIFPLEAGDRALGVLPFFHVFGFTCALWFPLTSGYTVVYHPSPMDARAVGELAARYRTSLLMATPTFFGHYLRRCEPEEFRRLRYAIAGGEKLPSALARAFQQKFGIELLEGYGATEMSPVVAVNVPDVEIGGLHQRGHKPGTVGQPIPGVAVRIVDPNTGAPLPLGREGLILATGPGRMLGYLGAPERTAEALREGWYVTGDIGAMDEEGFLRIADRLSRFSKIAGEMVPHVQVEQVISEVLQGAPCAVMAAPDVERGERLIALYVCPDVSPAELWSRLNRSGLPKLWIPKRENIHQVAELPPPLASGKLDLRRLKALALEKAGLSRAAGAGCYDS